MCQSTSTSRRSYLPKEYTPCDSDVICARGVEYYQHAGNVSYRMVIEHSLERYCASTTKLDKSIIVVDVVKNMRSMNKSSGFEGDSVAAKFVRFDNKSQLWYEIGDEAARQKTGQTIREILTKRDPEKRAIKAMKRATSKARRLARNNVGSSIIMTSSSDLIEEPLAPPTRSISDPVYACSQQQQQQQQEFIEKPAAALLPKRAVSDSVLTTCYSRSFSSSSSSSSMNLVDIALLASVPPTLDSMTSRDWFPTTFLSREDSDLSDSIDSLFSDDCLLQRCC